MGQCCFHGCPDRTVACQEVGQNLGCSELAMSIESHEAQLISFALSPLSGSAMPQANVDDHVEVIKPSPVRYTVSPVTLWVPSIYLPKGLFVGTDVTRYGGGGGE